VDHDFTAALAAAARSLGRLESTDSKLSTIVEVLETRQMIGQAVGLLMAKYGLAEDAAFGFLARMSSHTNTKLREIAERVVAGHVRHVEPTLRPD
jgi:AmiR/NasT family two-component response regulator